MDADHQLIVRLKAFLNSTELIDSPTSRELYRAYCALNNSAVERLVECEVLLQKKQKIEAVVLAQQDPNLFDLIDSLLFPERKDLLVLADLYDWAIPNEINPALVTKLKQAVGEMDNLRPLLTEFRRIARTDQVKNKLHLLREIFRIDKGNPEWRLPLIEVENQYLSQIIAEAQRTIEEQDHSRLEQIYNELKNTGWLVTVPTIVFQKIEKIITEHRRSEARKGAQAILEKINNAYGAYDVVELEDAVVCWNEHCRRYDYTPGENETAQLNEALAYLNSEKDKQKAQHEFQSILETISVLMNSSAPLSEVDKNWAKAESFGFEIPAYLANRVAKYRIDIEREQRTAAVVRSLKIIGAAAVILLVISGGAYLGIQFLIEDSKAKDLNAFIREGKIAEAQALIKDIEIQHPKVANWPKITRAKADLQRKLDEEAGRANEFAQILNEINVLKKQWPPDRALKDKLTRLEGLAKTERENGQVREVRSWLEDAMSRRESEVTEQFLKDIKSLEKCRKEVVAFLDKGDFEQAEIRLRDLDKLRDRLDDLSALVSKELRADHEELLKSVETLRDVAAAKKNQYKERNNLKDAIVSAPNLAALEQAVRAYGKALDSSSDKEEFQDFETSIGEISYFKAILNFQDSKMSSVPARYADRAYFRDARKREERMKKLSAAKGEMTSTFDSLQRNTNRKKIIFVRVNFQGEIIDIYTPDQGFSAIHDPQNIDVALKRQDGTKITLRGRKDRLQVTIGDEQYPNCRLVYPTRFLAESIRASRASHQILIEKIFTEIPAVPDSEILIRGIKFLDMIRRDDLCAPYWKMRLSLRLLDSLVKVDLSPDKFLSLYKDQLLKLDAMDNSSVDPLENKFLNEKIKLFFKNYDFSKLEKAFAQNEVMQKFYDGQKSCHLQWLGFALNVDKQLKYAISESLQSVEAEVFCFDSKTSGIIRVGRYGKNGLIIDDPYHETAIGHLLFTFDPTDSLIKLFNGLVGSKAGPDLQKIGWPEFWPQNMRGEGK
ncbi:MAG: hypothetical protein IJS14_13765 [Lentisphaeria bacterium]|nr:hypothetical protein [Lentisphaeria bacterium]